MPRKHVILLYACVAKLDFLTVRDSATVLASRADSSVEYEEYD